MSNMSYCRFENTLSDLQDCYDYVDDGELNEDERKARLRIIKLCVKIADKYSEEA